MSIGNTNFHRKNQNPLTEPNHRNQQEQNHKKQLRLFDVILQDGEEKINHNFKESIAISSSFFT